MILRNAIRCKKCGQVLESKHRHDFVSCECGNFVDGGHEYLRRGGNMNEIEELSEVNDKPEPERVPRKLTAAEWFEIFKSV
jgi:hypothetical protein